ncbi:MAG: hypothetical protein ACRDFS_00250 [Chloroflexota bacterium]
MRREEEDWHVPCTTWHAMFFSGVPILLVVPALAALGIMVALLAGCTSAMCERLGIAVRHRRCRYCHLGQVCPAGESVKCEGDDLVEVTCYVCRRCGLPQWIIRRTALIPSAK